jgi:hypothetical protein
MREIGLGEANGVFWHYFANYLADLLRDSWHIVSDAETAPFSCYSPTSSAEARESA